MPRFVQSAQDPKGSTHSHDGYLMLMIYLPQVFGKEFLPFIDRVLPPILKVNIEINHYECSYMNYVTLFFLGNRALRMNQSM